MSLPTSERSRSLLQIARRPIVHALFSAGGRSSSKTSLAISFLPSVGGGVLQHRQEPVGLDDAEHLGEQRLLVERREAEPLLALDQLGEPVLEAQALGAVEQVLDRLADLGRALVRALGLPRPVEAGHVAGARDRVGGRELEQVLGRGAREALAAEQLLVAGAVLGDLGVGSSGWSSLKSAISVATRSRTSKRTSIGVGKAACSESMVWTAGRPGSRRASPRSHSWPQSAQVISSRLSAWGVPVMSSLLHFGQAIKAMRVPFVRWAVHEHRPARRTSDEEDGGQDGEPTGDASPSVSWAHLPTSATGRPARTGRRHHGPRRPLTSGLPIRAGEATVIRDPVAWGCTA